MVNALLNNSRVRQLIENEHQNCPLLKLFKSYLEVPQASRSVVQLKQILQDYIVDYNNRNPQHPYDNSVFYNNQIQQDSPEFFDALLKTSEKLKELFAFETKELLKCKKCNKPLNINAPNYKNTKLMLYSGEEIFSTKQLLHDSRHVPAEIPCPTCIPRPPEVNMADTNEVFVSLPEILMMTVNCWEVVQPFLKKNAIVKPSPKIWIGDKVYVLRSVVQHHGASKGKF